MEGRGKGQSKSTGRSETFGQIIQVIGFREQYMATAHRRNNPLAPELGQGTADGFDGEAEESVAVTVSSQMLHAIPKPESITPLMCSQFAHMATSGLDRDGLIRLDSPGFARIVWTGPNRLDWPGLTRIGRRRLKHMAPHTRRIYD